MSTMLLIARMPAASSRRFIQSGLGPTFTSCKMRAVYRGQSVKSSTTTLVAFSTAGFDSASVESGTLSFVP